MGHRFRALRKHGFTIKQYSSEPYGGFFFVVAHGLRFIMDDPHKLKAYDPLLYCHAALCYVSKLDGPLKLRYPNLYTGVEAIVEKPHAKVTK